MPTPTPEQVRSHRASLGLTQTQYAHRLRVSVAAVQSWEIGRRGMPAPVWLLARALDVRRVRQALRLAGLWDDRDGPERQRAPPLPPGWS